MNDRAMDSAKCFKCALDQVFSCLYQDLYSNVLGINLFSISWRQKSKSIWEPEGNPISISLKPMETRRSNMAFLLRMLMGSMRA